MTSKKTGEDHSVPTNQKSATIMMEIGIVNMAINVTRLTTGLKNFTIQTNTKLSFAHLI
jgi:hypothetical protein